MWQIIFYFWQICLLKAGPEKIPRRVDLLGIFFAGYFLISGISIVMSRPDLTFFSGISTICIGAAVQALTVYSLLYFKRVPARFIPTMSALFGTNAIILVPMIATSLIMDQTEPGGLRLFADAVAWVLLGWWLTIVGSILSRAATISVLQGAMLAFLVESIALLVTLTIFPMNQS